MNACLGLSVRTDDSCVQPSLECNELQTSKLHLRFAFDGCSGRRCRDGDLILRFLDDRILTCYGEQALRSIAYASGRVKIFNCLMKYQLALCCIKAYLRTQILIFQMIIDCTCISRVGLGGSDPVQVTDGTLPSASSEHLSLIIALEPWIPIQNHRFWRRRSVDFAAEQRKRGWVFLDTRAYPKKPMPYPKKPSLSLSSGMG